METKISKEVEEKLKELSRDNNHSLIKRNDSEMEIMRTFGDQIDSRIFIQIIDNELEMNWEFWTMRKGTTNVDYYLTLEKIEETLKKGNRLYEKELLELGEKE